MKKVTVLGKVNHRGLVFDRVAVNNFPMEVWRNEEGKLCRFFHYLGYHFDVVDGMGTMVSSKDFSGSVLFDGYDMKNGIVKTDAGDIELPIKSMALDFLQQVKDFEQIIFQK